MHTAKEQLLEIVSPQQYRDFEPSAGLPELDPTWLVSHRPDAHWVALNEDLRVGARCSLWWLTTPSIGNRKAGLIGHYAASDDRSAARLLDFAANELKERGCTHALGPMDQNTWRDYRFVIADANRVGTTNVDSIASFFLEPRNQSEWPDQFRTAGLKPIANYFSACVEDLSLRWPRLDRVRQRMADQGITIRPVNMDPRQTDMRRILNVVKSAFADHLFYVDIAEADFVEMYRPLQDLIPEELILVAEEAGRVVGFCFTVPDLMQPERGQSMDTVIVKTLGVLPDRRYAGLGQVLLEDVHHRAAAIGFRRGIHALVRDTPVLRRISERYATVCRRYALFGKELSP